MSCYCSCIITINLLPLIFFYLANHSIPYKYVISLYWATVTTTTVGYGDILAHTDLERVYAIFIMIVGVVAYGYIIASVAASLANADSGRAQYQEKLNAVKSYMKVIIYFNLMSYVATIIALHLLKTIFICIFLLGMTIYIILIDTVVSI